MLATSTEFMEKTGEPQPAGPWETALEQSIEWDRDWADRCVRMSTVPWTSGVLPLKTVELISLALNAAGTNQNPEGTRRHIRAALAAGASRKEILITLKAAALMAIHSCNPSAPILLEEERLAGVQPSTRPHPRTPACDAMRAAGQWNSAWDPLFELDPAWTDQFLAAGIDIYTSGVVSPKFVELLSVALDASYTHMYTAGTRRHIKAALTRGASVEEIVEVLKLCVAQGVQACNMGVSILAEEMTNASDHR